MKIALIGCTSDTVFLAKTLAQEAKPLKIEKLSFYDDDPAVRDALCLFCVSLCKSLEPSIRCIVETNVVETLIGADYVVTDFGGFADARQKNTAAAVKRRGLLFHPLVGAGAFGAALRCVPAFLRVCGQARRYAKQGAQILNLTSPGGVLLQAAWRGGYENVYGFPVNGLKTAAALTTLMKKEPDSVDFTLFGAAELNALTELRLAGKSILPELLTEDALYHNTVFSAFAKTMLSRMYCLPSPVWSVCYYPEQWLNRQAPETESGETALYDARMRCLSTLLPLDAEKQRHRVLETLNELLQKEAEYREKTSDPESLLQFRPFHKETTAAAAAVLAFLRARQGEEKQRVPLLCRNGAMYPALAAEDCVAVWALVSVDETEPIAGKAADSDTTERVRRELYYERTLAAALVEEDDYAAAGALASHPLVHSCTIAAALTGELKKINRK